MLELRRKCAEREKNFSRMKIFLKKSAGILCLLILLLTVCTNNLWQSLATLLIQIISSFLIGSNPTADFLQPASVDQI